MATLKKTQFVLFLSACMLLVFIAAGFTNADYDSEYDGIEFTVQQTDQDRDVKLRLLESARRYGSVRVVVHYKMENYGGIYESGRVIQKHAVFMSKLQMLNVHSVNPSKVAPQVALIADEAALLEFFEMKMVEKVTSQRLGRTF